MKILFIDSSSKNIEFGYADDTGIILNEKLARENNADTLAYFIKESFEKKEISFENIEYVSLSNGPGSFTGLRISSAIAKGICYSIGSKLIELSTLDIIANKHRSSKEIVPLIISNLKISEFYFSRYRYEGNRITRLTEYQTDLLGNILNEDSDFIINESNLNLGDKVTDVSADSNIFSMYELTKISISENKFSDYKTSEPFYMKDFVPKV